MPPRSSLLAERWQDRVDAAVVGAAVAGVTGVALQTLTGPPWKLVGLAAATGSWLVFVVEAVLMVSVSPEPLRWARGHAFDLSLIVVTCPVWPLLLDRLLVLEVLPALTVLEAGKLAKLLKLARVVRAGRTGSGVLAATLLVAAGATAGLVLLR